MGPKVGHGAQRELRIGNKIQPLKDYPSPHSAEDDHGAENKWLCLSEGIKPSMIDIISRANTIIHHHKSIVGREKVLISIRKRRRITQLLNEEKKQ